MDRNASAGVKSTRGKVARVDQDNGSVTLDRGLTLKVDDSTQIVGSDGAGSGGIAAIHEGQEVRASYDAASNRARKIEVMSKNRKKAMGGKSSGSDASTSGSKQ